MALLRSSLVDTWATLPGLKSVSGARIVYTRDLLTLVLFSVVGGSNFGELLGALTVFLFTNKVHTPMPWLRLDALTLLIVWYLAFYYPPEYVPMEPLIPVTVKR